MLSVKEKVLRRVFIDRNPDYRASILLAGVGRSGTTWVSQIINHNHGYRYIFEPFHPHQVKICSPFQYVHRYLRPENRNGEFIEPAKAILSGRIRNRWIDGYNRRFICYRRLIKDIRANLLLKWLHVNFQGLPIILLFRHPCAVVNSKLQANWQHHLDELLEQDELMADFLNPFRRDIERAQTDFEKHMFQWCIENYVPLKQFKKSEIHLAYYEHFCVNPESEIRRVFTFLNKDFDEAVLDSVRVPSPMCRKESAIVRGGNLIDSWRQYVRAEDLRKAQDILTLFGLDKIYSQELMPDMNEARRMLGTA